MDTIEGDTLFILDPDLILDTESPYYDFKKFFDDIYRNVKQKFEAYKVVLIVIASTIGGIFLIALLTRFIKIIKKIMGDDKKEDDSWNE